MKQDNYEMTEHTRTTTILKIEALENLEPTEDGMDLNEGYSYEVQGSLPQLADSLAKMAIEMDKDLDLGDNAGGAFVALITQYYEMLKGGE